MSEFLYHGLGDAAQQAGAIGVNTGGKVASMIAADTSWAPFIGPIVAGVSLFVGWLTGKNAVYHAQETTTSNDANQIEQYLKANLAAYQAGQIDQATAEANYEAYWQKLEQACAAVGGPAGQRCVSDRQAGACTWKNDGKGGPAGSGSVCWNWDLAYRQPLLVSPANAPVPSSASINPLWLAAGGVALLVWGNSGGERK